MVITVEEIVYTISNFMIHIVFFSPPLSRYIYVDFHLKPILTATPIFI